MRAGTASGFFDKVTTEEWLADRCDFCGCRAPDVSLSDPKDGRNICGDGQGYLSANQVKEVPDG